MSLKELLGEELYEQVKEKLGDKEIDIVNDGRWIPKDKFDAVNGEKNEYKTQVETLNTELGKLKEQLEDKDSATETIEALRTDIESKEKELNNLRKTNAIKFEVLKANPNDVADILPHLDNEKITVDDNGITGLKEQIEALQESKPYLFKQEQPSGTGGSLGNTPKDKTKTVKNPWSKKHFNLTEQGKIFSEDPDLAAQLKEAAAEEE